MNETILCVALWLGLVLINIGRYMMICEVDRNQANIERRLRQWTTVN